MGDKIRTAEATTQDIFIDANDLIIDLMIEAEKASTELERKTYKKVIQKLTDLRNKSHGKG